MVRFTVICLAALFAIIAILPARASDLPPLRTDVRIAIGRDIAPGPSVRVSINTRNVAVVRMAVYRMDKLAYLLTRETNAESGENPDDGKSRMPTVDMAHPDHVWPVSAQDPKVKADLEQSEVYRSRQINLEMLPPGVYLIVASGGGRQAWTTVNVTNLAIVLKRAPRRLFCWVTDHATGNPVAGARARLFYRGTGRVAVEGFTAADGTLTLSTPPKAGQVLIVERLSGSAPDVAGLAVGNEDPDGRLVAHLQTDRPVYRPGNRVEFKAILRRTKGRGYLPDANADYMLQVRDSRETVIQNTKEKTNANGTIAAFVDIPTRAALGAYTIVLTSLRDLQPIYESFAVTEYRKPEFEAVVAPVKGRYLAGESAKFTLTASYYFGAPLPAAQVKYQVRMTSNPFYGGQFGDDDERARWFSGGDGNLYERDTYASQPFVAEGTVQTDAKGVAEITFPTKREATDSTYSVSCTVIDGQRRQVEAASSVPVYAALLRLGICTPLQCTPLESNIPVDLRLADLDGKPASGTVTVSTRHQVARKMPDEMVWETLSSTKVRIAADGKGHVTVPALQEGSLQILGAVVDSTGRVAKAVTGLYVADPGDRPIRETDHVNHEPAVTVRLDRSTYQPGDTVTAFISTNVRSRPTLLTIEGGDLFRYVVVPKGKASFTWKTTADVAFSPNAYVGAAQWAPHAHLICESVVLPVPDLTRRLKMTITPDHPGYRPGDRASFTIRTTDGLTGKPVAGAEAAVAVVDESIFAVRPDTTADPYTVYWGLRANLTETRVSAPEELSGGAYQRNNPNGVAAVRERFLDTAYWNARAVTGSDGTATVVVDMPGNLTSWRTTAIAITAGTQVGRATTNVTVSRPVMLRLSTPRQFVEGDIVKLIGTVNNRTSRARSFDVSLTAADLTLEAGEAASKTVDVPAMGEAKVQWAVKAGTIPANPAMAAPIEGTLVTRALLPGEALVDYSDRLRLSVPIRPGGVATQSTVAGTLESDSSDAQLTLNVPAERIEPASVLRLTVENGVGQAAINSALGVYRSSAWGIMGITDEVAVAASAGAPVVDPESIRDCVVGLARDQRADGSWGDWQEAPGDPRITARILLALGDLKRRPGILPSSMPFPDKLFDRAVAGAQTLYNTAGLWEDRTYLACALYESDKSKIELLNEVVRRSGDGLSPNATLLLAETLSEAGFTDRAETQMAKILPLVVSGPEMARVPAGDHPGWYSSQSETTAQALLTLIALKRDRTLQTQMAHFLIGGDDGGYDGVENFRGGSPGSGSVVARALLAYVATHGGRSAPLRAGNLSVSVNGTKVAIETRGPGTENMSPLAVDVPRELLKSGPNRIEVRRSENRDGELFLKAQLTVYQPRVEEIGSDMRVLRRFETQTTYGTWKELKTGVSIVRPGVPVRVTVVVWPNDDANAVKVEEPLPTGFEFVDSELTHGGLEEVRDGAIFHFLRATGATPLTFSYYLRAELEGQIVALPATGQLLMRPSVYGSSAIQPLHVEEGRPL